MNEVKEIFGYCSDKMNCLVHQLQAALHHLVNSFAFSSWMKCFFHLGSLFSTWFVDFGTKSSPVFPLSSPQRQVELVCVRLRNVVWQIHFPSFESDEAKIEAFASSFAWDVFVVFERC